MLGFVFTKHCLEQCWPEQNLKGPHSICAKNSSIQNVWKILEPKGPVGPAGTVMANTGLEDLFRDFLNALEARFWGLDLPTQPRQDNLITINRIN